MTSTNATQDLPCLKDCDSVSSFSSVNSGTGFHALINTCMSRRGSNTSSSSKKDLRDKKGKKDKKSSENNKDEKSNEDKTMKPLIPSMPKMSSMPNTRSFL
ncbi:hypothetical protein E4U53_002361 [Claviceps sorghi]|nr:hypothetical protein E4U53_002361 [Claviceps sorghi]